MVAALAPWHYPALEALLAVLETADRAADIGHQVDFARPATKVVVHRRADGLGVFN